MYKVKSGVYMYMNMYCYLCNTHTHLPSPDLAVDRSGDNVLAEAIERRQSLLQVTAGAPHQLAQPGNIRLAWVLLRGRQIDRTTTEHPLPLDIHIHCISIYVLYKTLLVPQSKGSTS